ncbi:MAG: HlyD family secretion protein [Syntrophales bacterium]
MDETRQGEEVKQNNNRKRNITAAIVFFVIAVIGLISVLFYVEYKNTHISTDDAYIDGNIHTIAPKVSGTVKAVLVRSNQYVKAGDVLIEIDPLDYDVRVNEAQAGLGAEKAKLVEVEAGIETARKQLADASAKADAIRAMNELQDARLEQAEKDKVRAEGLFKKEAMSREKYENVMTAYKVGLAQVKAATEEVKSSISAVAAQKSLIKQAEAVKTAQLFSIKQREALLETAKLNAGYTRIFAPVDGYVTKKSVEKGNQLQPGQPIMAIVTLEGIYVTANYKETQLEKVKTGQQVEIKVDTYPGKKFKGTVDSIMAGTGAVFSLFPAENATGNYVKVVQRIPVKIVFDKNTDQEHVLRVGMSVVPTILTGQ